LVGGSDDDEEATTMGNDDVVVEGPVPSGRFLELALTRLVAVNGLAGFEEWARAKGISEDEIAEFQDFWRARLAEADDATP
jgi:hypothetical protein